MLRSKLIDVFNIEYKECEFPYGEEESFVGRMVNEQTGMLWHETRKKQKRKIKILDIGGGSGRDAASLVDEAGVELVAVIDISDIAISVGKKCHSEVQFKCGDALDTFTELLPYAPYDIIYSHQFLHFVPTDEIAKLILHIYDLLSPGGWTCHAFLAEPMEEISRPYKEQGFVFSHLPKSIKAEFEDAGLEKVVVDRLQVSEYHHGKHHSHDMYVISGNKGALA